MKNARVHFRIGQKYGVNEYKKTQEEVIQELAIKYNESIDRYLEKVGSDYQADLDKIIEYSCSIEEIAEKLKTLDRNNTKTVKMITGFSGKELDEVYKTYASYLVENGTPRKLKIDKIDLSKNITEIEADIVNKIFKNICDSNFSYSNINDPERNYDVEFRSMGGAYGSSAVWVYVDSLPGRVNVHHDGYLYIGNAEESARLYIKELSNIEKDLQKKALKAVVDELLKYTISPMVKKSLKKFIDGKIAFLSEKDHGKIIENSIKIQDGYNAVNDILDVGNNITQIAKVLNEDNNKNIAEILRSIDYIKSTDYKERAANNCLKDIEKAGDTLADALMKVIRQK